MNLFTVKKIMALVLAAFVPAAGMALGVFTFGIWYGVLFYVLALALILIISHFFLLSHPFFKMVEGRGLLTFVLDSTGLIKPIVVNLESPFLKGKFKKLNISDVFDRNTVFPMEAPIEADVKTDGDKHIIIPRKNLTKKAFGFEGKPALFYNEQLKTFLDKDLLANLEQKLFSQHQVLLLNRRVEEQTSYLRDFHRYIVELSKPQKEWWQNKWLMAIVVIVGLIIVGVLLFPMIMQVINNFSDLAPTVPAVPISPLPS